MQKNILIRNWSKFKALSRRRKLAVVAVVVGVFMLVTPILTYAYFVRDINDKDRLMNRNNTGITLLDKNGEVFYSYGRTKSDRIVPLAEISDNVEKALIASEDEKFYEHEGFSIRGILGALFANITNKDLTRYGGSTLTQQLVKNNLLSSQKNILRKYQEVSIAIAVERQYTKDEILEMYLNSVYFGEGAFGIDQAAQTYFGKSANDLSLAESSMLVAILPAPSAYSPVSGDIKEAEQQQERVLRRMTEAGYIDSTQRETAAIAEMRYVSTAGVEQEYAQHFTQMVLEELKKRYGEETVTRSGYRVRTTLDSAGQKQAETTVRDRIAKASAQGATNGSLVAIDPRTGEIRALVGSADWTNEQFGKVNMAVTPRQPGSSFKPIYYTEAIDKRIITAATIIRDEAKDYDGYKPNNFDFKYRGDITVRRALATSLNIPAIEVIKKLGVDEAAKTAQRMGISTVNEPDKYGLTLALGTAETRLLDMTNAYAALAHEGGQFTPTTISSIQNKFNDTIYTNKPKEKRVQSKEASYIMSSILSDNDARAATFGSSLNIPNRQVAVKTGTTDENRDAWTIGYTPSLVVGVWAGDNTNKPMTLGGSAVAGPIWRQTMQNLLGDSPREQFIQPKGIVKMRVCNVQGNYDELFIRGTAPSRCNAPTAQEDEAKKREEEEAKRKAEEEERKRLEEEAKRKLEEENQDEEPAPAPVTPAPEPDATEEPAPTPTPEPGPEPTPTTTQGTTTTQ